MRSIEEIHGQIDEVANDYPALSELQSNPSPVSLWRAMKGVFAFCAHVLERGFDDLKTNLLKRIEEVPIGSRQWYISLCKDFQFGSGLYLINGKLGYNKNREDRKIIKTVGVSEGREPGALVVKVLKKNNEILSADERAAFTHYLSQVKIAGTKINIVSLPPISIKLDIALELDKEVFNAEGQRLGTSDAPIKGAINDFFKDIPFDGIFYLTKLVDALQSVEGVVDVQIKSAHYKEGYSEAGSTWEIFERKYEPSSGHLKLDEENSNITYITENADADRV